MKKVNKFVIISCIAILMLTAVCVLGYSDSKEIAVAEESAFSFEAGDFDSYTNTDSIIDNYFESISRANGVDYGVVFQSTSRMINDQLVVDADDPITQLVPKELFENEGKHLYIGKEYGFFVYTFPDATYFCERYGDPIINTYLADKNKRSIVLLFDIIYKTQSGGGIVSYIEYKIKPVFQQEYLCLYRNNTINQFAIQYGLPLEIQSNQVNLLRLQNKQAYVLPQSGESFVVPAPQRPSEGVYAYRRSDMFYLKDITVGGNLENTLQPNIGDEGYVGNADFGSFFINMMIDYNARQKNDVGLDTTQFYQYLGENIIHTTMGLLLPPLGQVISCTEFLAGIYEFQQDEFTYDSTHFEHIYKALYTTSGAQIAEYGDLQKSVATQIASNIWVGSDCHAGFTFGVSNSTGVDPAWETRITSLIQATVCSLANDITDLPSTTGKYERVFNSCESVTLNEMDDINNEKTPLVLMPVDEALFDFTPYNNGLYSIYSSAVHELNIIIEAGDDIIIPTNGKYDLIAGCQYEIKITSLASSLLKTDVGVALSENLVTDDSPLNLTLSADSSYLIRICGTGGYTINSSNENVDIIRIASTFSDVNDYANMNMVDYVINSYAYVVLKNNSSVEQQTEISFSELEDLIVGEGSAQITCTDDTNYTSYKMSLDDDSLYYLEIVVLSGNKPFWDIMNGYGKLTFVGRNENNTSAVVEVTNGALYLLLNGVGTYEVKISNIGSSGTWKINGSPLSDYPIRNAKYALKRGAPNSTAEYVFTYVLKNGIVLDQIIIETKSSVLSEGNKLKIKNTALLDEHLKISLINGSYNFSFEIVIIHEGLGNISIKYELASDNYKISFTNVKDVKKFTYQIGSSAQRTINIENKTYNYTLDRNSIISASSSINTSIIMVNYIANSNVAGAVPLTYTNDYKYGFVSVTVPVAYAGGNGTQANPYKIGNARHYNNISYNNMNGKRFDLISNINFSSNARRVIDSFNGRLEGNNYQILNISEVSSSQQIIGGLFRKNYGTISGIAKLTINLSSTHNAAVIGGVVGINYAVITYVFGIQGTIEGTQNYGSGSALGGVAGINESNAQISYASSYVYLYSKYDVGGIVGMNRGTINNCTFGASVFMDNDLSAGGIAGCNYGGSVLNSLIANGACISYSGAYNKNLFFHPNVGTIVGTNKAGGVVSGYTNNGYLAGQHNLKYTSQRKHFGDPIGNYE